MSYADTYSEIKNSRPFSFRPVVRNLVLDSLSLIDSLKNDDDFNKPRIQFLYIHHCFKDEENDLRRLLAFLSKHHRFISYSEAVNKLLANNIDGAYIVISSDDGFKNNMATAGILNEFGISACFFICPYMIEEKGFKSVQKFCSERLHLPPVEFMNWDDIQYLVKSGHEIGSHTMTHINVAEVSLQVLTDELVTSHQVIKKYCGNTCHFAYPYGKYNLLSEMIRIQVFDAGYTTCASAERGCHVMQEVKPVNTRLLIRRDHIILGWNSRHIKYFLRRNSQSDKLQENHFPFEQPCGY